MSRLESDKPKRFEIVVENQPEKNQNSSLTAVPFSLRKQAIAQFDSEFILSEAQSREARFELEKQQSPEIIDVLINAKSLFDKKEIQLAQNLYRTVIKANPKNELALRGAAECAKAFGKHEEALVLLKNLVENSSSSENHRLLGDQLYAMTYLEDAIEAYMHALQDFDLKPENFFNIFKNMGNIFLRLGDADGAEEFYNKAYTIDPDSDVLFVNYGSLFVYRGDYNKALERFRQAIQLNDKNDKGWVGLAMIHRQFGDLDLAWANVEKALDIQPTNESAIKLVADWGMKDNEIEKSVTRLETYLKFNEQDALVSMWQAKFLYFLGRLPEARIEIEKALCLDPTIDGGADVLSVIEAEMASREGRSR